MAVESLGKFINKKAKDATNVVCLLQMVPSCKSRPDNEDLDCESQGSSGDYMPEPPKEKLAQSCSDANGVFELVDEDEADNELAATNHKSGPLLKAEKEATFTAHQEYLD